MVNSHAEDDKAPNSDAMCWFVAMMMDETTFDRKIPAMALVRGRSFDWDVATYQTGEWGIISG